AGEEVPRLARCVHEHEQYLNWKSANATVREELRSEFLAHSNRPASNKGKGRGSEHQKGRGRSGGAGRDKQGQRQVDGGEASAPRQRTEDNPRRDKEKRTSAWPDKPRLDAEQFKALKAEVRERCPEIFTQFLIARGWAAFALTQTQHIGGEAIASESHGREQSRKGVSAESREVTTHPGRRRSRDDADTEETARAALVRRGSTEPHEVANEAGAERNDHAPRGSLGDALERLGWDVDEVDNICIGGKDHDLSRPGVRDALSAAIAEKKQGNKAAYLRRHNWSGRRHGRFGESGDRGGSDVRRRKPSRPGDEGISSLHVAHARAYSTCALRGDYQKWTTLMAAGPRAKQLCALGSLACGHDRHTKRARGYDASTGEGTAESAEYPPSICATIAFLLGAEPLPRITHFPALTEGSAATQLLEAVAAQRKTNKRRSDAWLTAATGGGSRTETRHTWSDEPVVEAAGAGDGQAWGTSKRLQQWKAAPDAIPESWPEREYVTAAAVREAL
ncbi:MAG: hypothetical protein SGPRY_012598, partial [Prymnesium sp.]